MKVLLRNTVQAQMKSQRYERKRKLDHSPVEPPPRLPLSEKCYLPLSPIIVTPLARGTRGSAFRLGIVLAVYACFERL